MSPGLQELLHIFCQELVIDYLLLIGLILIRVASSSILAYFQSTLALLLPPGLWMWMSSFIFHKPAVQVFLLRFSTLLYMAKQTACQSPSTNCGCHLLLLKVVVQAGHVCYVFPGVENSTHMFRFLLVWPGVTLPRGAFQPPSLTSRDWPAEEPSFAFSSVSNQA